MDKNQYSTALQNAVAFLKGQKIIKKEIEISLKTGFSKGAVSNYITGKQQPSGNFMEKFAEVYNIDVSQFSAGPDAVAIPQPDKTLLETAIRTESLVKVNAAYIAEIYATLKQVSVAKVLDEMKEMANSETSKQIGKGS